MDVGFFNFFIIGMLSVEMSGSEIRSRVLELKQRNFSFVI